MGNAKQRGTYAERKAQAIAAGRIKTEKPQPVIALGLPILGFFAWWRSRLQEPVKVRSWRDRARRRAERRRAEKQTAAA